MTPHKRAHHPLQAREVLRVGEEGGVSIAAVDVFLDSVQILAEILLQKKRIFKTREEE